MYFFLKLLRCDAWSSLSDGSGQDLGHPICDDGFSIFLCGLVLRRLKTESAQAPPYMVLFVQQARQPWTI